MTVAEIGGKAATLNEIEHLVNVKPRIVITVAEVEYALLHGQLPQAAKDRVARLTPDTGYAVRSSGVNEDSADHAWAGVFKTLLYVRHQDIEAAIFECINAISSANVIRYAEAHGKTVGGLAIIVQEMVHADFSGVLFTRDPRNGIHLVVESCQGTAEDIVSGRIRPCRYHLDMRSGELVRADDIEVEWGMIGDKVLRELFNVAQRLKSHFGRDVDIEWALDYDTGLYVNQCRPVTALHHVVDYAATAITHIDSALADERYRLIRQHGIYTKPDVLSDQNIVELLGRLPSPMAHGLFCFLFAHGDGAIKQGRNAMGYEIGDEISKGFHLLVGGQPRVSIIHDAFTYRIRGVALKDYVLMVNDYLERVARDPSCANYPEVNLYLQDPSIEYLSERFGPQKGRQYAKAYEAFFMGIRAQEERLHQQVVSEFVPHWNTLMQAADATSGSEDLWLGDAIEHYRTICTTLRDSACVVFVQVARLGFFAYKRSLDRLVRVFGEEDGKKHLNTLLSTTTSTSPNYRFKASLYAVRAGRAPLQEVIDDYGHLGEHELEIALPRYHEQPEILRMLAEKTDAPDIRVNVAAAEELERELATLHPALWSELRHDIETARTYLEQREIVKFEYLKAYDVLRRLARRIERIMDWPEGLIFYLDPTEVFKLMQEDPVRLMEVALGRRAERERAEGLRVPAVLFGDRLVDIGRPVALGTETILRGIGVTNQTTEGTCVVVTDLSDTATLKLLGPGSILVAVNTDPAWAPVIAALGATGGLITEVGGLLAHAAICAREIGTAAVLNVADATQVLKTGMRVRVNGPSGIVEILS